MSTGSSSQTETERCAGGLAFRAVQHGPPLSAAHRHPQIDNTWQKLSQGLSVHFRPSKKSGSCPYQARFFELLFFHDTVSSDSRRSTGQKLKTRTFRANSPQNRAGITTIPHGQRKRGKETGRKLGIHQLVNRFRFRHTATMASRFVFGSRLCAAGLSKSRTGKTKKGDSSIQADRASRATRLYRI